MKRLGDFFSGSQEGELVRLLTEHIKAMQAQTEAINRLAFAMMESIPEDEQPSPMLGMNGKPIT